VAGIIGIWQQTALATVTADPASGIELRAALVEKGLIAGG
jgi:hypothetical protein